MNGKFDPTKEVPSLELCKKLKESGFPQVKGGFWWVLFETYNEYEICYWDAEHVRWDDQGKYVLIGGCDCCADIVEVEDKIKAPTINEMIKYIKQGYFNLPVGKKVGCNCCYLPVDIKPDILAKDLIWLVQNGYVSFKK